MLSRNLATLVYTYNYTTGDLANIDYPTGHEYFQYDSVFHQVTHTRTPSAT